MGNFEDKIKSASKSFLHGNRRGQLTLNNLIELVITLIVLVAIFPVITSVISQGLTGLTNNGLNATTNSILSALLGLIPILIIIGYIVLTLLYMRPNYGQ